MTELRDSDLLNLPDAPDFVSKPPVYTAQEMVEICEKLLPFWNKLRRSKPPPPFQGDAFCLHPRCPRPRTRTDSTRGAPHP